MLVSLEREITEQHFIERVLMQINANLKAGYWLVISFMLLFILGCGENSSNSSNTTKNTVESTIILPEAIVSGAEVHASMPLPPGVKIVEWRWAWVESPNPAFPHPSSFPVLSDPSGPNPSFTAIKPAGDGAQTLMLKGSATGDDGNIYEGIASTFLVDVLLPVTIPVGAEIGKTVTFHTQAPRSGGTFEWVVTSNLRPVGSDTSADLTVIPSLAATELVAVVWTGPNGDVGIGYGDFTAIEPTKVQSASLASEKSVVSGSPVTLSVTSAGATKYQWTQTKGPAVTLSDSAVAAPQFVAPTVQVATVLEFSVVVEGPQGSSSKNVRVSVYPLATVIANAGSDQQGISGQQIPLHAVVTQSNGGALSYQWQEITSHGLSFSGNVASPSITLPRVTRNTDAEVQLTVTEAGGGSFSDIVKMSILAPKLKVDVSEVKKSSAIMGVVEHLSARLNDAVAPIQFNWMQVSGPSATLVNANTQTPSFEPSTAGTYVFKVAFTDAVGNTNTAYSNDLVTVVVAPLRVAPPPTASAVPLVRQVSIDPSTGEFNAPNVASRTKITLKVTATQGAQVATDTAEYYIADAGLDFDQTPGASLLPPIFIGPATDLTLHGVGGGTTAHLCVDSGIRTCHQQPDNFRRHK